MEQSSNATSNQQGRQLDVAWLTGLWEGEGCFTLGIGSGRRLYPTCNLVNSDFVIIEKAHQILDSLQIGHNIQTRKLSLKNANHKDTKILYIVGLKRVEKFCKLLMPHLVGRKKEVAATMLEWIEYRKLNTQTRGPHGYLKTAYTAKDFEYKDRMNFLNKKGPSQPSETIRQTTKVEDIVQAV